MPSTTSCGSVGGGITQALSPECTPASSTCSMTAPISTSPAASRRARPPSSTAPPRTRRARRGAVAGVHAALLAVLHDRPDQHLAGGVAQGVDVDLDGVLEEAVDQHR